MRVEAAAGRFWPGRALSSGEGSVVGDSFGDKWSLRSEAAARRGRDRLSVSPIEPSRHRYRGVAKQRGVRNRPDPTGPADGFRVITGSRGIENVDTDMDTFVRPVGVRRGP
jgi:hypothetical protein